MEEEVRRCDSCGCVLQEDERQKYVLNLMKPYANKMYQIGRNACHPLTPAVRNEWNLEAFEMEETEND